jgi:hypothetical protein
LGIENQFLFISGRGFLLMGSFGVPAQAIAAKQQVKQVKEKKEYQ